MGYEAFEILDDFFWTLVTEDDLGLMDNELEVNDRLKEVLFKFFARRLTLNKWTTNNRMPQEGKDDELDNIIKRFKIKRSRASDLWLQYKQCRGLIKSVVLGKSKKTLASELLEAINAEDVIENTICSFERYASINYAREPVEDAAILELCQSRSIRDLLHDFLEEVVQCLAGALAHATENTIDRRGYIFEMEYDTLAENFVKAVVLDNSSIEPKRRIRRWAYKLCALLVDEELDKALSTIAAELISDVADSQLDGLLQNSKETLYYVVSWALDKVKFANCLSDASRESFFRHNVLLHGAEPLQLLPTNELDRREVQIGKMRRCGHDFFLFGKVLECLYILNLTPGNAVRHKAYLFVEIDKVIKHSVKLKRLFRNCIPSNCCPDDPCWDSLYEFILKKYSTMRAGDVLRSFRNMHHSNSAADKVPLRHLVLAKSDVKTTK
jgi:hypothetical protein